MLALPDDALTVGCYVDLHYDNAVWYRGGPLLSRNRTSGNISHLTIHGREDVCFCGRSGCVDLYGAGIRLRQIHRMIFPDTSIEEIFLQLGDHPILQDYLSMMAYPIAMEASILDPDFVVLGGGILAMQDFPRRRLEEEIIRQSYIPGGRTTTFLPSAADAAGGLACVGRYAFPQE
jgi:allose kinase